MDGAWAFEVMRRAPYITVSFTRPDGEEMKSSFREEGR